MRPVFARITENNVYIANFHIGKYESPLFYANFKSWKYGPVEPNLYQRLKRYGANSIPFHAFFFDEVVPEYTKEGEFICTYLNKLLNKDVSWLIKYTHENLGAWYKLYPREHSDEKHVKISNDDILCEYNERKKKEAKPEESI